MCVWVSLFVSFDDVTVSEKVMEAGFCYKDIYQQTARVNGSGQVSSKKPFIGEASRRFWAVEKFMSSETDGP